MGIDDEAMLDSKYFLNCKPSLETANYKWITNHKAGGSRRGCIPKGNGKKCLLGVLRIKDIII